MMGVKNFQLGNPFYGGWAFTVTEEEFGKASVNISTRLLSTSIQKISIGALALLMILTDNCRCADTEQIGTEQVSKSAERNQTW